VLLLVGQLGHKEKTMIDTLLRPATIVRWMSGPFGPYLESYAAVLVEKGFGRDTVLDRLRAVIAFGRWLQRRGHGTADDAQVERFIQRSRNRRTGRQGKTTTGLREFLEVLRAAGGAPARHPGPDSPLQAFLRDYLDYLDRCRGLACSTRQIHGRFALHFLERRFGTGPLDWSTLTADDITAFVQAEASTRTGHGPKTPASSIRVLIRYLVVHGLVRDGLQGAVPKIRHWKQAHLPERLSAQEVKDAIGVWREPTNPASLRNRAILLLLARLGLRAQEVRHLRLEDIDWNEGRLLIRSGKTRRERSLPLSQEIGDALAAYLKGGRSHGPQRQVFLALRPPHTPLQHSSAVSSIVRVSLERAEIPIKCGAAHLLRHTVATHLVRAGATFKDVADVLGHEDLQTTGIYAKLDLESLSRVALPWPGGVR
jgi:site-specific recombinase XerD